MATTNIPSPEPSPEAKAVQKADADLRKWLGVTSSERKFQPFWLEPDPAATVRKAPPPSPVDNGWGTAFDLEGLLADAFSAVDTHATASSGATTTPTPGPPKGGASAT